MSAALPRGWAWLRLDQFAAPEAHAITDGPFGSSLKTADYVDDGEVRVIRLGNLGVGRFLNESKSYVSAAKFAGLTKHEARPGDLIVAALAEPVGRCVELPVGLGTAMVKADCVRVRVRPDFERRYLLHALNSPGGLARAEAAAHGMGRLRMNLGDIRSLLVPTAPPNEQRRIVAKLDALQARSRRAREALDAVPPLLEKLRQSILAAAFRGDLTKDWRAKNPNVEPATKLLERIRTERRKKWEESELAKLKAKGKPPTDDKWKAKYKEAALVDTADLPELPKGWCWASLDELVVGGPTNGFSPKSESDGSGTPTLKLSATTAGVCVLNGRTTKRTSVPIGPDEPYWLSPGDLLIQRANTLEHVGVSAIYEGPPRTYIYPDLMMRVRGAPAISPRILWRALSWDFCRKFMRERATGTSGNMPKVNGDTVRAIPVPLPPLVEQVALLEAIDNALTVQGRCASGVGALAEKVQQVERTVLTKAFRGELVPQYPNDEPAETMLARREASAEAPGAPNDARPTAVTPRRSRRRVDASENTP